jgi:hypothetical protein
MAFPQDYKASMIGMETRIYERLKSNCHFFTCDPKFFQLQSLIRTLLFHFICKFCYRLVLHSQLRLVWVQMHVTCL